MRFTVYHNDMTFSTSSDAPEDSENLREILGVDPTSISRESMILMFRSAWLERQNYARMGIFTGAEARRRYERFRVIERLATERFGLNATEILDTTQPKITV